MAIGNGVVIRFLADTGSAIRNINKLERATGRSMGAMNKATTVWSKTIGPALAGAAVAAGAFAVKLGVDAVQAAANLEETLSRNKVLFGAQAQSMEDWADTATQTMGQTQKAALDAAAVFATLGKSFGLSGGELADWSRKMVGLAGDLSSFWNATPEDAAAALASGLRGESEPLRKYGVLLSDAAVQSEALASGIVTAEVNTAELTIARQRLADAEKKWTDAVRLHGQESTEAARASAELALSEQKLQKVLDGKVPKLTEEQKVLARSRLIWKQTADAQGDYARTAGSVVNKTKAMTAGFEDVQTAFGQGFLSALTGDEFADGAQTLEEMEDTAQQLGETFGGVAVALQETLVALGPVVDKFNELNNMGDGILTNGTLANVMKGFAGVRYLTGAVTGNEAARQAAWTDFYDGGLTQPANPYEQYRPMRYSTRSFDASGRGDGRAAQRNARTRTRP